MDGRNCLGCASNKKGFGFGKCFEIEGDGGEPEDVVYLEALP